MADDDLWLVPADGGVARRRTADRAPASHPRISADGSMIAWTSRRDGPPEVYLAGTSGGSAQRVTHWSDRGTRTHGWSPDGELLVTTSAGQPFVHHHWAYAIPVDDGAARFSGLRRLPFGPVADLAMNGRAIALQGGWAQEPAFWKRYRGGTAGRLWLSQAGADGHGPAPFRRVLDGLRGQMSCPMLVAGRLARHLAARRLRG